MRTGNSLYSLVRRLLLLMAVLGTAAGCGRSGGEDRDEGAEIARGRTLFLANACAGCHGKEGHGDGRIAPALKPPPRDFRRLAEYKRGHRVEEMAETIRRGIALGGGRFSMPPYPHLSAEDRRQLALFIHSLQEREGHAAE